MDNCENKRSSSNLLTGVFVIALGVVLLLDHMGIFAGRQFLHFWPVIFLLIGFAKLFQSSQISGRVWGGILILMGVALQLNELGYLSVSFSQIWPVFIIIAGVMLIVREMEGKGSFRLVHKIKAGTEDATRNFYGIRWPSSGDSSMDSVSIFGSTKRRITTRDFRGGKLIAMFGGFNIDLREADMEGNEAVIEANAVMGGGEIRVPYSWSVTVQGVGIFGGYVDETQALPVQPGQAPAANPAPTRHLIVKGVAIFGGIVVKN